MKDTRHCSGCRDNFYNGNNSLGVPKCWGLETAKLVMRKEVHKDQVPPWTQRARKMLDCFHQQGYVYVAPDRRF